MSDIDWWVRHAEEAKAERDRLRATVATLRAALETIGDVTDDPAMERIARAALSATNPGERALRYLTEHEPASGILAARPTTLVAGGVSFDANPPKAKAVPWPATTPAREACKHESVTNNDGVDYCDACNYYVPRAAEPVEREGEE